MLALFLIMYIIYDIINLSKHPDWPTSHKKPEPPTKKYVKKYASNVFDDLDDKTAY